MVLLPMVWFVAGLAKERVVVCGDCVVDCRARIHEKVVIIDKENCLVRLPKRFKSYTSYG
jgi:hypothetical protein